jgi:glycosyltransferase involved in cell wall biosynthesis
MLGDVSLRRECAGNLRKRVEDTFTLERMAKETLAVYEEAIGR